jgi:hypothetical protein
MEISPYLLVLPDPISTRTRFNRIDLSLKITSISVSSRLDFLPDAFTMPDGEIQYVKKLF